MLTYISLPRHSRSIRGAKALRRHVDSLHDALYSCLATHPIPLTHRQWLTENSRLISATLKELQIFAAGTAHLPLTDDGGTPALRVTVVAKQFLEAPHAATGEEAITAYLQEIQEDVELEMAELWAFKPALQLLLIERLIDGIRSGAGDIPIIIGALRLLADARWREIAFAANHVDRVLARDPSGAYDRMDDESRDAYLRAVSDIAHHSGLTERAVAEAALALAWQGGAGCQDSRAAERRRHVGYYLVDDGAAQLRAAVGYRASLPQRMAAAVRRRPTPFYLGSIAVLTLALVVMLAPVTQLTPWTMTALLLLLLPATQAAIEIANGLATRTFGPRPLPKLDFADGVPEECATLVAVPALLLDEAHVRELVMDMEIRYLANRDRNIMFALVTNSRDSQERSEERSRALSLAARLVAELNERYGSGEHTPFYLLHRFRYYSASEERWIGWERKRGKLLDLNQLLRGVRDRFPIKVGHVAALQRVRYVLVLDSDTELPRDAARRLIGAIAHPLNRAVIDPATRTVVEGYGIIQPRICVNTRSAASSWLAKLYAGETGFDIYTRAVSDVYQDLFGEGIFTGKGIYEVDVFRDTLEQRFPANTLLSHDLIEGLFARAALVSDVELIDDYPTHFSAYSRRRHRWMRGDWQILRWLLNRVPDFQSRLVANPLRAIARWKIFDNLRRTLVHPATATLLVATWFASAAPAQWTLTIVALLPQGADGNAHSSAFVPWLKATLGGFARSHLVVALHLVYLLHDALLAFDAILRALARMFVTQRRLLEWETAAEASKRSRGATDIYLRWSPVLAVVIGGAVALVRQDALATAAPLLVLWTSAGAVAAWLNRRPHGASHLGAQDTAFLREHTLRSWTFFSHFSSAANNWLIPDSVRADGAVASRLSPTNLAMLLNARVAAVRLGYLTLTEFVVDTRRTLATVERLRRHRGHLLNWYDCDTLAVLEPRFVSTVDSGNLAAALWTLKQSALAFAEAPPGNDRLWEGITDIARVMENSDDPAAQALAERIAKTGARWRASLADLEGLVVRYAAAAEGDAAMWAAELLKRLRQARLWCDIGMTPAMHAALTAIARTADALVMGMDFGFLYDARRKVLSVGYDLDRDALEPSTYDLMASEARIASFVAIAKGDIPQESWFHLGRTHVAARAERVMLSWTGTLFEYLMPAFWFRHGPRTIMHESMRAAVAVQRKFARARRIPWGFSESAFVIPGENEYGYAPCGLPDLALKPLDSSTVVVSPYSASLALLVDRSAAIENLRNLRDLGCVGTYGFYEAIDYSHGSPQIVEAWMAHHQGMSLLAAAAVLLRHPLQDAFHAEPHVRATERLLEERLPAAIVADAADTPVLQWAEENAA